MRSGETDPKLRRIYLVIYVEDGSALALDADVSPPAGSLQVSRGLPFVDAIGSLVHWGFGGYYYEADASEITGVGFIGFKFERAGYRTEIAWAPVGSLFSLGETDPLKLRWPMTIYGDDVEPPSLATGATVTSSSDLQTSHNGDALVDAAGSLVEVGSGLYYYQGVTSDAAVGDKLLVKYQSAGFATSLQSIDVTAAGSADAAPTPSTPITVTLDSTDVQTEDPLAIALNLLCQQFRDDP